jgi:thioredoxin-related protein
MWITIFLPLIVQAQGIQFESGLSWQQIKAKAQAENKYIFMDCYATWCGPCKFMAQQIFTQKEVGDYFNSHFINVAVQIDRTSNDPEAIRNWYTDASVIESKFGVNTFPTYLFFSPKGTALHRIVGVTGRQGKDLIEKAKDAFEPSKQYYTIVNGFKDHLNDSTSLYNDLARAIEKHDRVSAEIIANAYLMIIKFPITKDNIKLIGETINSTADKGFQLFLDNAAKIDTIMGTHDYVDDRIDKIILNAEMDPLFSETDRTIDFKATLKNLKKKYPTLGDRFVQLAEAEFKNDIVTEINEKLLQGRDSVPDWVALKKWAGQRYIGFNGYQVVADQRWRYYMKKQEWPEFEAAMLAYMKKYSKHLDNGSLNNNAYYLFLHTNNQSALNAALKWSKRVVDKYPKNQATDFDTYANLLYKTGHNSQAIEYETRALKMTTVPIEKQEFATDLEKMKTGKPTW